MIDYDLSGQVGRRYPGGYHGRCRLVERHEDAQENHLMKEEHDRHSITYLIKHNTSFHPLKEVVILRINEGEELCTIAEELERA